MNQVNKKIKIRIKRYLPEPEPRTFYQDYEIDYYPKMFVLDALNAIKEHLDGTLSFRWSCRMGVCGSCGAEVNGVPQLTCATPILNPEKNIVVGPLHNFPIIKDLVVDIKDFMEKLVRIKPWILRERDKAIEEGEYRQTPEQIDMYHQTSMCINCMLCYAACPVFAVDREFIGPAASALAYRYNQDSRDGGARKRLDILTAGAGIFDCTFVGECSTVCPKNVDPALAIQRLKKDSTLELLKSILRGKEK